MDPRFPGVTTRLTRPAPPARPVPGLTNLWLHNFRRTVYSHTAKLEATQTLRRSNPNQFPESTVPGRFFHGPVSKGTLLIPGCLAYCRSRRTAQSGGDRGGVLRRRKTGVRNGFVAPNESPVQARGLRLHLGESRLDIARRGPLVDAESRNQERLRIRDNSLQGRHPIGIGCAAVQLQVPPRETGRAAGFLSTLIQNAGSSYGAAVTSMPRPLAHLVRSTSRSPYCS